MIKKIGLVIFTLLLTFSVIGVAYAEMSAQTYTRNSLMATDEQPVFIQAYNNSGSDIEATSNFVVVIDTSAITTANQASNCVGTYFTTTTTDGSALWLGVTDGKISSGSVGRICVRGPHKVDLLTDANSVAYAAGATIGTTTTAGYSARPQTTTTTKSFGVLLGPSGDRYPSNSGLAGTNSDASQGAFEYDNNVWWAWIGK